MVYIFVDSGTFASSCHIALLYNILYCTDVVLYCIMLHYASVMHHILFYNIFC
jgi:hypothetical protein